MSTPKVVSPSTSSYDYLSARSNSGTATQSESFSSWSDDVSSDDEIIWSMSDLSLSSSSMPGATVQQPEQPQSPGVLSEEDFIVLSRPRTLSRPDTRRSSPTSSKQASAVQSSVNALPSEFKALSLVRPMANDSSFSSSRQVYDNPSSSDSSTSSSSPKKSRKRGSAHRKSTSSGPRAAKPVKKSAAQSQAQTESSESNSPQTASPKKAKAKAKASAKKTAGSATVAVSQSNGHHGLGNRDIVDDVSEAGDHAPPAPYQNAVEYITKFLSNRSSKSQTLKPSLPLLQALIIELGLCPSALNPASTSSPTSLSLPNSLRAAKALLKSRVFLNVRDYLAVRSQGLDALQRVMKPSRGALMREIKSGKRMPRESVKSTGLSVLLVTCF
ncbi:hypothetical protein AcV5_005942 [Taiwanofungus camphoratus]|nr:hypothetical protein AcW2_004383 [Antrodia cinnamomea]KAI0933929.1 hypothetical protein AcV5_005942 [Antrodia cinnamomea]KAI0948277.1 hypothetical protein AcV7_009074 [Antrodia cinnamomea]